MISPDLIDSLRRYVENGIPTGGFLRAILANDLKEACARADSYNRHSLFYIVEYCCNEIPSNSWGSYEKVDCWIENHEARREAHE